LERLQQGRREAVFSMRRRFANSERFRDAWRTALFVLLFFLVLFAAGFLTATAQTYPRGEAFAGFSLGNR
jgi:hypothetical protein